MDKELMNFARDRLFEDAMKVFEMKICLTPGGFKTEVGTRGRLLQLLTAERFEEANGQIKQLVEEYRIDEFTDKLIEIISPLEEGEERTRIDYAALKEGQN